MDEATTGDRTLSDEDILTVSPGCSAETERPRKDDTDSQDADGRDGDATDQQDGDAKDQQDADGTDTQDSDTTDSKDSDGPTRRRDLGRRARAHQRLAAPLARCIGDAEGFLAATWGRRPAIHASDDRSGSPTC